MTRRNAVLLLGAALVSAVLSGCTSFAPVYGDANPGLSAARFNYAPPTNRLEQIILQRLQIAFPGSANPADPTLRVVASSAGVPAPRSDAVAVSQPIGVRIEATVTVASPDGTTLFEATRFTDTSYQGGRLTPTNLASAEGARETAAESTAESLRAAILAGYRP